MENIGKIKERIAKLLAMAKDASSPEEAAIAASRARKLMDMHQLDQYDIDQSVQEAVISEPATKSYKFMPIWLNTLHVAVAKYNDCFAFREWTDIENGKSRSAFRGYDSDVRLAKAMFDYLVETGEAQCKEYMRSIGHGSYYMAKIGDAWKKGYARELVRRLEQLTTERDAIECSAVTGTSLVVIRGEKIAKLVEMYGEPNYTKKSSKRRTDEDAEQAYQDGVRKGSMAEINKKVEG